MIEKAIYLGRRGVSIEGRINKKGEQIKMKY